MVQEAVPVHLVPLQPQVRNYLRQAERQSHTLTIEVDGISMNAWGTTQPNHNEGLYQEAVVQTGSLGAEVGGGGETGRGGTGFPALPGWEWVAVYDGP